MGFWNGVINVLVIGFALFFTIIGIVFLLYPATGSTFIGEGAGIEGGPTWDKAVMGLAFLLAAAPMYYYVFNKNARGLPPVEKRPPGGPRPPTS